MEVTTASGKKERIEVAPSTTYVITKEDIQRYGYKTLAEALDTVPGVTIMDDGFFVSGGQRGFLDISFRSRCFSSTAANRR